MGPITQTIGNAVSTVLLTVGMALPPVNIAPIPSVQEKIQEVKQEATTKEVTSEPRPSASLPSNERTASAQQPSAGGHRTSGYAGVLSCIRRYEQGRAGYATNTGNGYYGAYQFDLSTWRSVGGVGYPHRATPAEQDYRAVLLIQKRGLRPWPTPNRLCRGLY